MRHMPNRMGSFITKLYPRGVSSLGGFTRRRQANTLQFFIIPIYLLQTAADKKNTHKIETKADKADHRRKLLYLFDPGHDLGNPVEHTDARKGQCNTIDDLNKRFVFTRGIFLAVVQFFGIHDIVSTLKDSRIQGLPASGMGSSVFWIESL